MDAEPDGGGNAPPPPNPPPAGNRPKRRIAVERVAGVPAGLPPAIELSTYYADRLK